nr:reverse transcriptase domain-containing protein [Tanacetum cinerariifolium]
MRISGFMHGITNPDLIKKLNDNIPKSVDEMMSITSAFLRGEVAAANQSKKKAPPAWKHHETSRRPNFDKRLDFKSQHNSIRWQDHFTPLTKTPKEILAMNTVKFKAPPPMTEPVENQNKNKFCEFHGDKGHSTNECIYLRRQIEEVVKSGQLSHLVKEIKQRGKRGEQAKAAKKGSSQQRKSYGYFLGLALATNNKAKDNPELLHRPRNFFLKPRGQYQTGNTNLALTSVLRSIAKHRLNICDGCQPIRQKRRGQAPNRNKAIQEEFTKLVEAKIMWEVHYHDWLSNPVMKSIEKSSLSVGTLLNASWMPTTDTTKYRWRKRTKKKQIFTPTGEKNKKRTKSEQNRTKMGSVEKPDNVEVQSQSKKQKKRRKYKVKGPKMQTLKDVLHSRLYKGCFCNYAKEELKGPNLPCLQTSLGNDPGKLFASPDLLIRSSSRLTRDQTSNPTSSTNTTPKGHTSRSSKQKVENSNLEEHLPPIATMADQRTMAQLLQAPTKGYKDAIVVSEITADNFELKHGLLTLVQNKQFYGHDKEDPHAHIHYFNKIIATLKFLNVPNTSIKLMLFPFSLEDQDSLNSAAGGNFLDKMPSDCLRIIESKSKVRYSRDKTVAKVSMNTSTSGVSPDVAELKDLVRALLLDKKGKNQSPALRKAVEESYVTCGGAHSYYNCPATDGNVYRDNIQEFVSQASAVNYSQGNTGYRPQMMLNQIRPPGFPPAPTYQAPAPQTHSVSKEDFSDYVKANDAVMKNMQTQGQNMRNQLTNLTDLMIEFVNSNTASTLSSGTLPSNKIANPKSDLKAITTRSGVSYDGPLIPPPVVENAPEATKDTLIPTKNGTTEDVQPQAVPSKPVTSEPANTPFASTLKALIGNKEKLSEMARTPLNEHCSAVLLKKLPEKLGDPGKFLILCDFPGMAECLALADLGASINLMPYSTERALIDVFEGELTLRVGKEAITFNLDQTSRYSANYNDMTTKRIDVIDMACEEYSQEVLGFFDTVSSGNSTPFYDPIISTTSPTLTPFGDKGDIFLLEAFLNNDPSPPPPNQRNYLPEVRKELKICEVKTKKSSVDEPPVVELKALPPHLKYAFLEGDDKLSVIIAKDLSMAEKAALTNQGVFCYTKMPFGLKNAGATYQRLEILRDIEETFHNMRRINMKLNPKKCTFGADEGAFLGHIVSMQGIKACPQKTKAVMKLQSPQTLKEAQSLNGNLASLNIFLCKAFQNMKTCIAELSMVTPLKPKEELIMYLCAVKEAVSTVLLAERESRQCIGPTQAKYVVKKYTRDRASCTLVKAIRSGYYWPTMHKDAQNIIRACSDCQTHRPVLRNPQQKLTPITSPLPFYKFEFPGEIISDNGKQFRDNPFKDWCEKLNIKQRFASVKHPQTNHQVERINRSLGEGIKARLGEDNRNWVEEVPHVLWAHRIMIKISNIDTSFSLTYGTESVIPVEIGMPSIRYAKMNQAKNDEELLLNLDILEERREKAAVREDRNKAKMERYYNAKVRITSFRLGDFVYRSNEESRAKESRKLGPK